MVAATPLSVSDTKNWEIFRQKLNAALAAGTKGTTTNDNAAAGQIGEYISANVPGGSSVPLVTNTAKDVTSIILTPGDWEVSGNVVMLGAAGTTSTINMAWLSSTSATIPVYPNAGALNELDATLGVAATIAMPTGARRYSLAVTTTIYLSCLSVFAVNTKSAFGFIGARRMR